MMMLNVIKWISTLLLVSGGIIIAINIPECKWWFVSFTLGHIALIWIFVKSNETALWVQSLGFLLIDFVSIYHWFGINLRDMSI